MPEGGHSTRKGTVMGAEDCRWAWVWLAQKEGWRERQRRCVCERERNGYKQKCGGSKTPCGLLTTVRNSAFLLKTVGSE